MDTEIEKIFNFPPLDSVDCSTVLLHLFDLQLELFTIFGIDQEATSTKESKNYNESTGWLPMQYSEVEYYYKTNTAFCSIKHTSMYNGHMGDAEDTINLVFETGNKKLALSFALYCFPCTLYYKSYEIPEPLSAQIEARLCTIFGLSIDLGEKKKQIDYDNFASQHINYDDHKHHK